MKTAIPGVLRFANWHEVKVLENNLREAASKNAIAIAVSSLNAHGKKRYRVKRSDGSIVFERTTDNRPAPGDCYVILIEMCEVVETLTGKPAEVTE